MVALASIYVGALLRLSSSSQQKNVGPLKMSTAVETDKMAALATAADEARGLAMDSIAAAHSGHMGLPLGAAEIGAVLYGSQVRTHHCLVVFVVGGRRVRSCAHHLLDFVYNDNPTDDLQPQGTPVGQP